MRWGPTGFVVATVMAGVVRALASDAKVVVEEIPPVPLEAGRAGEARIAFRVAEGFHVQANPAANEFLIPVELSVTSACGISAGKVVYPKAEPFRLEGSDETLATYGGRFEIRVALKASRKAQPGACTVPASLRYQACDDKSCLFPATIEWSLPVEIRERP